MSDSDEPNRANNTATAAKMSFDAFREHFIPLRKAELTRQLAERLAESSDDRERFINLCRLIDSVFHFEFHDVLRDLKEDYSLLDPDSALIEIQMIDDAEREIRVESFFSRLSNLLTRANYRELSKEAIDEAISAASAIGVRLRVDFDVFAHLRVFVRGDMLDTRVVRNWKTYYRRREVEIGVFQRLVVIFRFRSDQIGHSEASRESVYLKIFKNIPKTDLDMLLPGSKVRMSAIDQLRILVPTLSGIAVSVVKIFKVLAVLTLLAGFNLIMFIGLVGGTIGYGIKSVFGYLRTKDKYRLSVTQHLYFQNLDNNAGVLFRVLNEAEEQEFREAIVAYFLLWQEAGPEGWTKGELDRRAEEFLHELLGVDIDFEDEDALGKLGRLGLAEQGKNGRWTCVAPVEALQSLDRAWDNYYQFHVHESKPSSGEGVR